MSLGLSRGDLQVLTDARFNEAAVLFSNGHWSGAYYLGGYAVELGLKACIAKMISADVIPEKNFLNSIYTHVPSQLVGVAGLSADLKQRQTQDPVFHANWGIIGSWGPDARYKATDRSTCQYFFRRRRASRSWGIAVDKDVLVAAGHVIVKALDGGPMEPALAMWVHVSDLDVWKLWLAPRAPAPDKMRFYRLVAEAISNHRNELHGVEISSIVMINKSDPGLAGMARFMHMPGLGSAYMSNNRFNDLYIQDGIALRIDL